MRLLHTADWHLGHRLYDRDRTAEHRAALAWLLEVIEREGVDVLVVAGDVFDVTNPSNQARELYYDFLGKLAKTGCSGAVVVGGNHDSAAMLDAPRDVLRSLNLHVVGAARTPVRGEVIRLEVSGTGGEGPEAVIVAAVPYLRERDLRKAAFGETAAERLAGIQAGIREHYAAVATAAVAVRQDPATPIVATGHLFAGGASDHEEKKSYIYQADEHNIAEGDFPAVFDYVALGHVHRAQRVGAQDRIRYAGSLVPLTFVEGQQPRSVRIVDLGAAGTAPATRSLTVPYFRQLLRLHADLDTVRQRLRTAVVAYQNDPAPGLTPWAEVRVRTEEHVPNLNQLLDEIVGAATDPAKPTPPLEFARRSQERLTPAPAAAPVPRQHLEELDPEEVFAGICRGEGLGTERQGELLADFRQLRNWMDEESPAP